MEEVIIKNNSNVAIHGLKPGATRKIDVDKNGVPLDVHWRRRLRDNAIDGAITIEKVAPETKFYDVTED